MCTAKVQLALREAGGRCRDGRRAAGGRARQQLPLTPHAPLLGVDAVLCLGGGLGAVNGCMAEEA